MLTQGKGALKFSFFFFFFFTTHHQVKRPDREIEKAHPMHGDKQHKKKIQCFKTEEGTPKLQVERTRNACTTTAD
jgi:hypothetical protein